MITLLIATRNAHKVGEIRAILGDGFRYLTLNDVPNPPEVIEDAGTFAGNATKKAVVLAKWLGESQGLMSKAAAPGDSLYVLADDSGLEVDALSGAPGVHSARFAALDTGAGQFADLREQRQAAAVAWRHAAGQADGAVSLCVGTDACGLLRKRTILPGLLC